MQFSFTHSAARTIMAASLLGIIVPATPLLAASHTLVPVAAKAKAKPKHASPEDVEARIKELHSQLRITPEQEPAWNDVAQVMRDNAKRMLDLRKERTGKETSMNAIEALQSYAEVIDAHAEGIHKFIPVFQKLYGGMSDEQKKIADAVFRNRAQAAAHRHTR
jgi:hypothetical protein